jgi:octaprenyl-diphosphate synthase
VRAGRRGDLSNLTSADRAGYPLSDPLVSKDAIGRYVLEDLGLVETMFRQNLASPLDIVEEIGTFVAEGGGKRIRPTLHLLCAKLCRYEGSHHVLLATVLEFIHSATLIHDDIIDEATTRRGHVSVNHRWGNDVTVLFGDYLFAKAMEMALRADSIPIMRKLAEVTLRMTEGEMLQTRYLGRLDLTVEEYLDLIQRKTAGLFACCCDLAAILAQVDEDRRAALRRFGLNLGMAFQLVDDVLDFTGKSETLGKPAASDLREGKATLAVIELLNSKTRQAAKGRDLARRIMESGEADTPEIDALSDLLETSGAITRARAMAERFAVDAGAELGHFEDSPVRRALASLPDLVLVRDR